MEMECLFLDKSSFDCEVELDGDGDPESVIFYRK